MSQSLLSHIKSVNQNHFDGQMSLLVQPCLKHQHIQFIIGLIRTILQDNTRIIEVIIRIVFNSARFNSNLRSAPTEFSVRCLRYVILSSFSCVGILYVTWMYLHIAFLYPFLFQWISLQPPLQYSPIACLHTFN